MLLGGERVVYKKKGKKKGVELWGEIGDGVVRKYRVEVGKMGSVGCWGVIKGLVVS